MKVHDMVFVIIVVRICFGKTTLNQPLASQQGVLKMLRIWVVWHHIFTEEKGCYYEINPKDPQFQGYGDSGLDGAL